MRKAKSKILLSFIFLAVAGGLIFARQSSAYSTNNTHPFLTEKIVEFHNLKDKKNRISKEEIKWMKKGAVQEDDPPRWINHFYDPVHKTGWTGKHYGNLSEEVGYEKGADMAPKPAVASIDWAENQEYQAAYGRQYGNRTWQKAVKSYIDGDKETAFLALGDILHLIEDLSVPAHTRNDSHPGLSGDPGSPYEDYAKKMTNFYEKEVTVVSDLVKGNKEIPNFQKLSDAFNSLADYSNKNFFSEDTIDNKDFKEPDLEKLERKIKSISGKKKKFLVNSSNGTYLAIENGINEYSINDEKFILPSYRSHLFPKAVLTGAGVIDLFFRDVEKYKKNPELLKPIVPDSDEPFLDAVKTAHKIIVIKADDFLDGIWISALKKGIDAKDALASAAGGVKSEIGSVIDSIKDSLLKRKPEVVSTGVLATAVDVGDVFPPNSSDGAALTVQSGEGGEIEKTVLPVQGEVSPDSIETTAPLAVRKSTRDADLRALSIQLADAREALNQASAAVDAVAGAATETAPEPVPPAPAPARPKFAISQPYPGFGGGGGGGVSVSSAPAPEADTAEKEAGENNGDSGEAVDTTPPLAPVILFPSDFSKTFTSPDIAFSGTAEASSTVSVIFADGDLSAPVATTTADSAGAWFLPISFKQGSSTVEFFAADAAGNVSSSTEISLLVDSEAPDIALRIADCLGLPSDNSCLSATTTLNISWQSNALDLSFFAINANGAISTTTATSTTAITDDNSTYSFSVSAVDAAGNRSATTTQTVEISTMPVVINEVAWSGTATSSADEWIELYNRTDRDINLSGWTLYSETDMKPYIKLSKTIPAKGYYLIERTDDNATSEPADWYGSFGNRLGSGLSNNGEVLALSFASTTVDRTPDAASGWVAGTNKYYSMERRDPNVSGENSSNWGKNNGIIKNGKNADGGVIAGTPKARNSVNYLINNGQAVTSEITLTKENSPYLVNDNITTFQSSAVLNIEPGVVIKFYNDAGLRFTGDSKIIVNGTKDDPIVFTSFKDDEYGGDLNGDATTTTPSEGDWFGVKVETDNGDSVFNHTIFRFGGKYYINGLDLGRTNLNITNTSAKISNSTFEYSKSYGLLLSTSSSTISNSVFKNNKKLSGTTGMAAGLGTVNSTTTFSGVVSFENNYFGIWSDTMSTFFAEGDGVRFEGNSQASTSPKELHWQ
ncbi:MAG: hypothetical protein GXP44_01745 [bacterium]|nr:hypothetical protein [bacterium]